MKLPALPMPPGRAAWSALLYFNVYRLLVVLLFVSLSWIGQLPEPLGLYDRRLFSLAAHAWLVFSLAALALGRLRMPPYLVQVVALVFADIVLITLLMYASDGLGSGFGMLLVIVVAGGALLLPGRFGILFASLATLAVLGHEVYTQLHRFFPAPNYTHAGFLGITFFGTAIIGNVLASRVRESEALAEQRGLDLQNLARLNEHIVQHLDAGILVLDQEQRISVVNESARFLLSAGAFVAGKPLAQVCAPLAAALDEWQHGRSGRTAVLNLGAANSEVQASFRRISVEQQADVAIFLEDVAVLRQRAQQLKLASLGRLTASIAHEVRNPLGAISHAAQLLSESDSLQQGDQRLISIIEEQSRRVSNIVESIMSVSRGSRTRPEQVDVQDWLREFRDEFSTRHQLPAAAFELAVDDAELRVLMDPDQLHRVLWNLCENGLRYSRSEPRLRLRCGVRTDTEQVYIDVADSGSGVAREIQDQLFEPFVTTEPRGTGLGLYISREICEANQAELRLHASSANGACFRISFVAAERAGAALN
jgi:two-component system sensor histidine kinase PilS (NtrC family)